MLKLHAFGMVWKAWLIIQDNHMQPFSIRRTPHGTAHSRFYERPGARTLVYDGPKIQ
jgi:hypothetical protein